MPSRIRWSLAALLAAATSTTQAGFVLFHMQGEPGKRQLFYANISDVRDRTPVEDILNPLSIKELPVVVVYEAADAPEWSEMRLQFECSSKYRQITMAEHRKARERQKKTGEDVQTQVVVDGWNDPSTWNAPVKMRMGPMSNKVSRTDLTSQPLPETQWASVGSASMLKAQKFACQQEDVNAALQAAIRNNSFDQQIFNDGLKKIGLLDGVQALEARSVPALLDLSWKTLWAGSPRPDPSGLWSKKVTPEQQAKYQAELAAIQAQMNTAVDKVNETYLPKLKKMQAEREFVEAAAKIRGNRDLSRLESSALMVWLGRDETEVGKKMGAPRITQTGELKFLGYGQSFDNTSAVVHVPSGQVFESGVRTSCDAQFVMLQDKEKIWRVADIRVSASSNRLGVSACNGLLTTPDVEAAGS